MTRQTSEETARAWIEIDLGALRRNVAAIARHSGVPVLPMVKADAYGLGALGVARALDPMPEVCGFGVATVDEAIQLREAGVSKRLLTFTPLSDADLASAAQHAFVPVLTRGDQIDKWSATRLPWHLGIDTGMSRAGVRWDAVGSLAPLLRKVPPPEGACSHFHSAERADGSLELQERRFAQAVDALPVRPPMLHIENSAAIARNARSRWSFVRPGIFLYGVGSGPEAAIQPEPVVSLRARVVELRRIHAGETVSYGATWRAEGERTIATLPVGYADGYRRSFSGRAVALLKGTRVPVAGTITMDMAMLDVSGVPCVAGDVVTLIGPDGNELLSVEEVSGFGDLIAYEVLTGLRQRLPRRYVGHAA